MWLLIQKDTTQNTWLQIFALFDYYTEQRYNKVYTSTNKLYFQEKHSQLHFFDSNKQSCLY